MDLELLMERNITDVYSYAKLLSIEPMALADICLKFPIKIELHSGNTRISVKHMDDSSIFLLMRISPVSLLETMRGRYTEGMPLGRIRETLLQLLRGVVMNDQEKRELDAYLDLFRDALTDTIYDCMKLGLETE